MFSNNKIIVNQEKNKKGEEVKVFLSPEDLIFNTEANFLTIPTEEGKMQLNFKIDKKDTSSIYISDILVPKGHNKGYGKILLKTLIKLSKEKKFKRIDGQIFSDGENEEERKEHKKIQIAFYKKHGFEILENNIIVKFL